MPNAPENKYCQIATSKKLLHPSISSLEWIEFKRRFEFPPSVDKYANALSEEPVEIRFKSRSIRILDIARSTQFLIKLEFSKNFKRGEILPFIRLKNGDFVVISISDSMVHLISHENGFEADTEPYPLDINYFDFCKEINTNPDALLFKITNV